MAETAQPEHDAQANRSSNEDSSDTENEVESEGSQGSGDKHGGNTHFPQGALDGKMHFTRFTLGNSHMHAKGKVSKRDGRLRLSVFERTNKGFFAQILGTGIQHHLDTPSKLHGGSRIEGKAIEQELERRQLQLRTRGVPKLNIVIMVIGSRGDIQPFIKIGKVLKEQHGHRVRIATHPAFKEFVETDCGLEFFSVGGDPSELMAFMVKNPGLIPSLDTLKKGEVGKRRASMAEMFEGFWQACITPSDDTDSCTDEAKDKRPFVADAIIANPPSFAHVHCAERLGCPLHLIFTFPYTPTSHFPHPLANIQAGNVDWRYTNFMSYPLVEMMTWQGLGDLVNRFRVDTLGLDPVSTLWAPGQLYRLKVPYTYLWSPSLVAKPDDWGPEINIAGFVFLDLASNYKPPNDLKEFLEAGEPPVYIGFGSIVVDDPDEFSKLIFEAVDKAGVRAVINKGWGGFGGKDDTPSNVFMLDNIPHDWLFPRCSAVVHHGGAGTTAIGLKCAKPTMIVPFFGDQPFWGSMVAEAKAGAHECIPYKKLTSDKMAEGIRQCLSEEAQKNVQKIADSIVNEGDGAVNAVNFFHDALPWYGTNALRCSFLEDRVAVWKMTESNLRLSALAAELLVRKKRVTYQQLELLRAYEWNDFQGPGGPITGVSSAIVKSFTGVGMGLGEGTILMGKDIHHRARYEKRKLERQRRRKKQMQKESQTRPDERKDAHGNEQEPDSPSLSQKLSKRASTLSKIKPKQPISFQLALDVTYTVGRSMEVVGKAPIDLLLGLGQGLHNAPRIYGDNTVRRPRRISDLRSGVRAGSSAFAHDMSDAFTGLVCLPARGAKAEGAKGLGKGVGKGLAGLVLKSSAAVVEPLAFTMKGLQKELASTPVPSVRAAREEQGKLEADELSAEQEAEQTERVEHGWSVMIELWQHGQALKKGLTGRLFFRQEKRMWREYGAFESIEVSERALEARKKGIPFNEFMESYRQDVEEQSQVSRTRTGESSQIGRVP